MEPFLSDAWFERHVSAQVDVDDSAELTTVVQHFSPDDSGSVVPHVQMFSGARLTSWARGVHPDASWALLHETAAEAERFFGGGLPGNAGLTETWVLERDRSRIRVFRPPPLDEGDSPAFDALPPIRDATISVQVTLEDSPFGQLSFAMRFEDGRRTAWTLGYDPEAAVFLACPFSLYLRVRAGRLTLSEGLGRLRVEGRLGGELWDLMLAVGVAEGPEYRAIRRQSCATAALDGLAAYADIVSGRGVPRNDLAGAETACLS